MKNKIIRTFTVTLAAVPLPDGLFHHRVCRWH